MANYCNECGTALDNDKQCPRCNDTSNKRFTGTFSIFWFILLFSIPFIGLIAAVIFTYICKDHGIKNFAKAFVWWHFVGLALILFFIIFSVMLFWIRDIDITLLFKHMKNTLEYFFDTIINY